MSTTLQMTNGDLAINAASGQPLMLTGRDALKQAISENLTISTLQNGFGAGINNLVGIVPIDSVTFNIMINQRLRSSVNAMISLQSTTDVTRTTDELLTGISYLDVAVSPTDPRVYFYYLNVSTVAGPSINASGTITR